MQRTAAKSYEIETWLRDRLRTRGFYERLAFIKIQPSSRAECGWEIEFDGQLSEDERGQVHLQSFELQRLFSLEF
jgi:hypothetical protein